MGGHEYLKSQSIAGDLGILFSPKALPHTRLAFVVNNARAPKAITLADGTTKQLSPCSYNVGMAQQLLPSVLVAVDGVDLSHAYSDKAQLRAGVEWKTPLWLSFRAGYNSGGFGTHGGTTVGLGIKNFCVAYSKTAPLTFAQEFTF